MSTPRWRPRRTGPWSCAPSDDAWLERMGVREAFCAVNPVVRALDALSSYSTYRGEEEVDGGTLRTSSSLLPCRKSRRCGQGAAAELTAITELTRAEPAARASTCLVVQTKRIINSVRQTPAWACPTPRRPGPSRESTWPPGGSQTDGQLTPPPCRHADWHSIMGAGPQMPYPKWVWTPAGGWCAAIPSIPG